ncbi:hypothetical protein Lser_V15G30804 [Lactuca serriola]
MIIKLLFLFIFFFTFTSSSPPTPPLNFTMFGTTILNQTSITLTHHHNNCISNPPDSNIGRIFYKHPIRFLDSSFNSTDSFFTRFTFTVIPPPPPCLSGEGIAFLITSDSNSLSRSVGSLGLPKPIDLKTLDSSFLAVEFDTNFDQGLDDINDNHVGVDLDSIVSVASVDLMTNGINLKSGKQITAWIEYRNPEKIIQIWVGYTQTKPENPILVSPIDLSKRFSGYMYVGFSAANGRGSATHLIDSWYFKTSESMSPIIDIDAIGPGNCFICFPVVPLKEEYETGLPNNHHKDKRVFQLAVGLLALNLILILLSVGFVVFYMCVLKRRNQMQDLMEQGQIRTFQEKKMPRRLELSVIRSATKGFSRNQIISQRPSATVYEANLPPYGNVAVKRFRQPTKTGSFGSQFAAEFATMVGSLSHKNLMQLQGWCCERNELVLVYEYMPNGSLDKILHTRITPSRLNFGTRLNVLLGVSSALIYLHEECERPIIHRNVKSCNIMLDVDFTPKLGDFGTAELYEHSSRAREATVPAGTMGYLAPEYVYSGVPTVKTDVYSFGVLVLEVASGRRPVDENGTMMTDWVWDLWEDKELVAAADPNLMGRFHRMDMEMMLMAGLICVHPNYEMRPTMKEAMRMLQGGLLPDLPATKPTVMIRSVNFDRSPEAVVRCGVDEGMTSWGTPKSHFSKH